MESLLALGDSPAQQELLQSYAAQWNGTLAAALKAEADRLLRADVGRSLEVARLIQSLGALSGAPCDRALGLLAEANARSIGLGAYQQAVALYEEAAAIYADQNLPMEQARAQVGKVGALSFLGRYAEANRAGQWAGQILEAHGQWQPLATLFMNLAIMHARMGEDTQALVLFNRAGELYATLGEAGRAGWLWVQLNRAFVLRNLGQFEASMAACRSAQEELTAMGQTVAAARAQQNLALTHFILGQYNEALKGLDQVRDVFVADGRQRDAMLVDLFVSNCLLQLRRYHDVLETCRQVRNLFTELGAHDVAAKAILNEGVAHAGLGRYEAAIVSLEEARSIFAQIGNQAWTASAELEIAAVLRFCGDLERSLAMARRCSQLFRQLQLPVEEAQAYLIAARAALRLSRIDETNELAGQALAIGQSMDIASLIYPAHHLLGRVAAQEGLQEQAVEAYGAAIEHLERLRGRLMVEFRADFLEDKTAVYEDMVLLCVALDRAQSGLEYVERAKSRALVEMLAFRLDVSIQAREPEDEVHVDELMRLRAQRDQMYRRWQGKDELKARGAPSDGGGWEQIEQEVLEIENRITKLWHKLLVRNADYARDAALWQVQIEPIQPYLDAETALIEYFVARDVVLAFVVTGQSIVAQVLPIDLKTVQSIYRLLRLNLDAVPHSTAERLPGLTANAQALLHRLYQGLVAPLDQDLRAYPRWIVVPYGPLHYLPFQALFDGAEYLVERHEISYLPGASLLRFCLEPRQAAEGVAVFGHSFDGQLPNTVREALAIQAILGGDLYVERDATPARFRATAGQRQVLHLAAHGNFRPNNPLFSGLALADGWLTTLDIFNLRLNASLVTLSACQTGRSTVGGGDELLGLMRALLYAGAASLVLTLWTVEDRSTSSLMQRFYQGLSQGQRKGSALRQAQLAFIHTDQSASISEDGAYAHPYFWAPFFLVGDAGAL
jgi:CHAT domain-containing protein/tetratricopeptide (TPR) repeat protein